MSSYIEAAFERRIGDDSRRARYNMYRDANEQKEYFSQMHRNQGKKSTRVGKSLNQSDWGITEYVDDKKSEKKEKYDANTPGSILGEFGVDVSPLIETVKKAPAKKAPAKAPAKAKKVTKAKKTSAKKGGRPKKKSSKKKSQKKSSKKKSKKKSNKKPKKKAPKRK